MSLLFHADVHRTEEIEEEEYSICYIHYTRSYIKSEKAETYNIEKTSQLHSNNFSNQSCTFSLHKLTRFLLGVTAPIRPGGQSVREEADRSSSRAVKTSLESI